MSSIVSGDQRYYHVYREIPPAPKKLTPLILLERALEFSDKDVDTFYYIAKVLKDDKFIKTPQAFIATWAENYFDQIFIMDMERNALEFFFLQPELKINLEQCLYY